MSEKRNDFQELRELRKLRDMYQTRVDSKFGWSEGKKDKSSMKKFLDSHPLKGAKPETLKKLQNSPKDKFGVTHLNLIHSEDNDRMYCFLEAPDKEAIKKHHYKFGYKCDFILEVNSTADD